MQISTNQFGEGIYEGIIQEKDDWYVLSQLNRHAYLSQSSEELLEEHEDEFAAVKGHLSAQFEDPDEEPQSSTGEFYLQVLEVGEVLGTTEDGRVISEFEDGIYVSSIDRYDPDPGQNAKNFDLDEPGLPLW